jgi:hypothetical protein
MNDEASSKEVEDLISEVDELSFQDYADAKPEKKKEKKKKSSKGKKTLAPPNMGPPPTMGPPSSAPGKPVAISNASLGGTLGSGRHSLDNSKSVPQDDMCVLEDADDFNSPVKSPQPKSVDIRPANGGNSPTAKPTPDTDDYGSAGALGGQSSQSRARVLAQQRELQMKRRQQAMSGSNAMLRSTEDLGQQDRNHTPAMRQFGPRDSADDPYNTTGRSDNSVSDSQEFVQRAAPIGGPPVNRSYDSNPPSPQDRRPPDINTAPSAPSYDPNYDAPGYDAYPGRPVVNARRAPPEEEQGPYAPVQSATSVYVPNSPQRGQPPPQQGYGRYPDGPSHYGQDSGYDGYGYGYGRGGYDDRGYPPRGYDDRGGGYGYGPAYERGAPMSDGYDQRPISRDGPPRGPDPYDRYMYDRGPGPGYDPRGVPYDYMGRGGPMGPTSYGDVRDPYMQQPPMGRGEPQYDRGHMGGPSAYKSPPPDRMGHASPAGGGGYEQHAMAQPSDPVEAKLRQDAKERQMNIEQAPAEVVPALAQRVDTNQASQQAEELPPFDIRSLKLDDTTNLRNFLMNPAPKEAGVVQCYIKRDKSTFRKMFPEYRVYIKIPTANGERDLFLMCGKKRSGQKTSNYLISMSEDDLRRTSHNYLGKLRANFVGTEFRIYDNGSNPDDVDNDDTESSSSARQELGVVQYESNVMGSRGPRRMQVGLPRVQEDGSVAQNTSKESMMAKFKKRDFTQMVVAYNKPPRWNEHVGAFVLNFSGRVTMASVKNFQLITHDDQDKIILQFGRISKAEFTMDFQYPMTPFQAFAITLSSFDSKIACD